MTVPIRALPTDSPPSPEVVEQACAALRGGGLVALPTETVYGLAARADDGEALAKLAAVKGRDPSRPFTWHAPGAEAVLAHGPEPRAVIGRLAERYWPGPVTLVLETTPPGLEAVARKGWTGVRVPAQDGTREVLSACDFPVVATSANPSGDAPLLEAAAVQAAFGDDLELVLDGGPSRLAEASTVLVVGPGRFEVLREGLVNQDDLRAVAGRSLLFVCTGNTCRSPMAEALARAVLAERLGGADPADFGFHVASAGVAAGAGGAAAPQAIEVMAERDLDLRAHSSSPALVDQITATDHVYCLTQSHRAVILGALPPGAGEHVQLLDPDGGDVPDPVGAPVEVYRECADVMQDMIGRRAEQWA